MSDSIYPFVIQCRRANGDTREIAVSVETESDTVAQLTARIWVKLRGQGLDESRKQIRLIYTGKLLTPSHALLKAFNLVPNCIIHLVLNDRTDDPEPANPDGPASVVSLRSLVSMWGSFLSSSSGRSGSARENADEADQHGRGRDVELTSAEFNSASESRSQGLDVLRSTHSLDASEVQALRAIFRDDIDAFARAAQQRYEPQDTIESGDRSESLRIEAAWLLQQGSSSEFIANLPRRPPRQTDAHVDVESPPPSRSGASLRAEPVRRAVSWRAESEESRASRPSVFASLAQRFRPQGSYAPVADSSAHGGPGQDDEERVPAPAQPVWDWQTTGNLSDNGEDGTVLQGLNELGTARDFAWGFILGFSLGTLMLLCVFERSMNYRNKCGIIFGVLLQLLMSISVENSVTQGSA